MSKEQILKIYAAEMENQPDAPEKLRNAYAVLHDALEDYTCEIEEYMFLWAYPLGYEAGRQATLAEIKKGGVA